MKKLLSEEMMNLKLVNLTVILSLLVGCSSSSTGGSQQEADNSAAEPATAQPEAAAAEPEEAMKPEGLKLIESSDCIACHQEKEQLVGPPYRKIAERYKATYDSEKERLITTVIEGGSGIWGEVPMTAHPQHTREQVVSMLDYIMTLAE